MFFYGEYLNKYNDVTSVSLQKYTIPVISLSYSSAHELGVALFVPPGDTWMLTKGYISYIRKGQRNVLTTFYA
jgi:hypothetical protein